MTNIIKKMMDKNVLLVIILGSLFGIIFGSIFYKNYRGTDFLEEE